MRILLFVWGFVAFSILGCSFFKQAETFGQNQDFESNFNIVNHPDEFLPLWSANEIRSTAARVFQANLQGRNNSRALAVQPIANFDGLIYTLLNLSELVEPKIAFFAKTNQNGSGNRPAVVLVSFSTDQVNYSEPAQVGNDETFGNRNSEFRLFEVPVPEEFWMLENVYLKIEVKFGQGLGSAARFFMDDFGVYSGDEVVDPIRIADILILDPFSIQINFDRDVQVFDKSNVFLQGMEIVSLDFPDNATVIIRTNTQIPDRFIQLSLEDIMEMNGAMTEELNIEIDNSKIQLGEIIIENPNLISLRFSQHYINSEVSQTSKYLINGANPSEVALQEDGYSIKLALPNQLLINEPVKIEAQAIKSVNQNTGFSQIREFVYEDGIENIFVKTQDQISLVSTEVLDFESFRPGDFSIVEREITFSEWRISTDKKAFDLIASDPFEESISYTLRIPPRKTVRGKQLNGSIRDFVWDASAPEVVRVIGLNSREVLVVFSERVDPVFALILSYYRINGYEPVDAQIQGNESSVILKWSFDFLDKQEYTIEVEGIADLSGNTLSKVAFDFLFESPKKVAFKSLIINEIMPAPRAGNTLPNVEYVEIFNTSSDPIALGGFQLVNSRRTTNLPSEVILPNQYIVLCPRTQVSQFERFGNVIGLTNWPTLLNSADKVKIYDNEGATIDSLNYTISSFGGSVFASGGYSLEIVNPYITCNLSSNLKASTANERGTPGRINSVFDQTPDRKGPVLLNAKVFSSNQVLLSFSKSLNSNLSNIEWYINPNLTIRTVEMGLDQESLILIFEESIQEGVQYKILINGLRDCIGNLIQLGENEAVFTIPSAAANGDIVINEVLFNANSGAPKFVEVYNQSNKFINLKDWKLANLNSSDEIANRRTVSSEDLIIEPNSFLVFTTDVNRLISEYPKGIKSNFLELNALPSYPQASGNVVWLSPDEEISEIFSYSERMHHRLLKEVRGVSLERLSANEPVSNPDNWKSASASIGYASPGFKNSNVFDEPDQFGIEIEPKVFVPDAAGEQNFTTISYKMDSAGKLATIRIYGVSGQLIREICQNDIWGTTGFYTWDGTDASSRKVRPGYYILTVDIFDLSGNTVQIKKTVVVGSKIQ